MYHIIAKKLIANDWGIGLINSINDVPAIGEGDYKVIVNHATLIEKQIEANNSRT
jgi:hypothetical protein